MKRVFFVFIFLLLFFFMMRADFNIPDRTEEQRERLKEITGTIKKGETLSDIFKKYGLNPEELFKLKEASASVYRLREIYPGRSYRIIVDDGNRVSSFDYWIDDDSILNVTRTGDGFSAEKKLVEYDLRLLHIGGMVKDNLISSIGEGRENLELALRLSDIFSWDIDFTSDLRQNDRFKVVVEGLYLNGGFKKYGDILSAEFEANGETCRAYRFSHDGKPGYYDENGKMLRRQFLKAPLSFRRISSGFSHRRFHPILKIYRAHHGLDYSAPKGTPVSAAGDGKVVFSGYKGQYGKLVIIKHNNGYRTYYGHLHRLAKNLKKGERVEQGRIIGYVGSTGLATGPHLHYEMRINGRPVNLLKMKMPGGKALPKNLMADFKKFRNEMDGRLVSITPPSFAMSDKKEDG